MMSNIPEGTANHPDAPWNKTDLIVTACVSKVIEVGDNLSEHEREELQNDLWQELQNALNREDYSIDEMFIENY